jgi:hypothetical protein
MCSTILFAKARRKSRFADSSTAGCGIAFKSRRMDPQNHRRGILPDEDIHQLAASSIKLRNRDVAVGVVENKWFACDEQRQREHPLVGYEGPHRVPRPVTTDTSGGNSRRDCIFANSNLLLERPLSAAHASNNSKLTPVAKAFSSLPAKPQR